MISITDQQIDDLIEAAKPNFRIALRAAMEHSAPAHMFEIAKLPLTSGQEWPVVVAILLEPMAAMLTHTILQGVPAMFAAYEKAQKPAAPQASGFAIPGA